MAYKKCMIILSVIVIFVAILLHKGFFSSFVLPISNKPSKISGVLLQEQLAKYNGINRKKLYLAVIGIIFDVTKGKQHYGEGGSYNYFIGKDGSRAFITGDFSDESKDKDHVLDLPCHQLLSIFNWRDIFKNKYKSVGRVVGRYYDENGQETPYNVQLNTRFEDCKLEIELEKKHDMKYPPCNAAWDVDHGTKVWCTKASGGISRNWVGVPRQLFVPGTETPSCVCVDSEDGIVDAMFKEYANCPRTSTSCVIK